MGGGVGRRRREWDKSLGPTVEGRISERPPPRKQLNLPQRPRPTRKKKKKEQRQVSGKKITLTDFCSISSSIPASSSRLLPSSKHRSLNLLRQQHFCFQSCRLVHPVESCMKDTKEKKNIINDNSNNENLLYVGVGGGI